MNVVARTSLTRVRLHITYFLLFVRRTVRQVGQETVGVVVRTVASGRPDVKRVMLDWWCLGMRLVRLSKRHAGRALSSRCFCLIYATNRTPSGLLGFFTCGWIWQCSRLVRGSSSRTKIRLLCSADSIERDSV